jgi:branched-chain amino acid transport system substrate-binding protein
MERKIKITIGILVVVLVVIVLLEVIVLKGSLTGNFISNEKIKIGFMAPLTGPTASQGEQFIEGRDFFMERYKGKLKNKVEFIVEDTQGTATGAVSATQKLINIDNVTIVTGFMSSTEALAVAPLFEKAKVLFFIQGSSSPKLSAAGKYIFRHALLSSSQGEAAAEYIIKENLQDVCVFYMNDETGKMYYNYFQSTLEKLDKSVKLAESFEKTTSDFKTEIAKLKENRCLTLYFSGTPKTIGILLKQSNELDYHPRIISTYGIETQETIDLGGDLANGIIYTGVKTSQDFIAKFSSANKENPKIGHVLSYDSLTLLFNALEKTKGDSNKMASYFESMDSITGVTGKIFFNSQHDVFKEIQLKIIENGEFVDYS